MGAGLGIPRRKRPPSREGELSQGSPSGGNEIIRAQARAFVNMLRKIAIK
jgi:hypothetical protein